MSCAKFYPGSFSYKSSQLKIQPGLKLHSEINIIIDLPRETFGMLSEPSKTQTESDEYSPVNKSTSASSGQTKSPF